MAAGALHGHEAMIGEDEAAVGIVDVPVTGLCLTFAPETPDYLPQVTQSW